MKKKFKILLLLTSFMLLLSIPIKANASFYAQYNKNQLSTTSISVHKEVNDKQLVSIRKNVLYLNVGEILK